MSRPFSRRPRPEEVAATHARLEALFAGRPPAGVEVTGGWVPDLDEPSTRGPESTPIEVPDQPPRALDRLGIRPGAAVGLVAVAALAVIVAAVLALRARPHPVAVAAPTTVATTAVQASPSAAAAVVVDVAGRVRRPGLVTLPAGARVADALRAAGGARPGTDLTSLNLARRLVDGEQIVVGGPPPAAGGTGGGGTSTVPTSLVDLNTASVDEIEALPGIGPVLAQRIVEWRTAHGGFRDVAQLRDVSGIGDAKYAELQPLVRV